jgi:hypothetical protein
MLKGLLVAILVTVTFASATRADPIQFVYEDPGAKKTFAGYARVELDNTVLGYTDLYGRIDIRKPPGDYRCRITFLGRTFTSTVNLTGSSQLRVVMLRP